MRYFAPSHIRPSQGDVFLIAGIPCYYVCITHGYLVLNSHGEHPRGKNIEVVRRWLPRLGRWSEPYETHVSLIN